MFVAIGILVGLVVGTIAAVVAVKLFGSTSLGAAQRNRKLLLDQAERDAETTRREAEIAAREDAVQLRAFDFVPYVPTAQFILPTAYRTNLTGVIIAPITLMWNVEKK